MPSREASPERSILWIRDLLRKLTGAVGRTEKSAMPVRLGYLFLAIPMYIFFFGWLKLIFALLLAAVLTVGLYFAWKEAPAVDVSYLRRAQLPKLVLLVLIAGVWVYLSGVGQYAFQNYDHMWRNAILEKLVNNKWPVIVTETGEYFDKPVAMIYYFALWLPAACWGKLFGLEAAHGFLYWWCVVGVVLVFTLLSSLRGKLSPWMLVAFVCFSGLDVVGDFILHNSASFVWFNTIHVENWMPGFQMSSFSTQLFWVFNQAIPAWLITLLLLCQKDNKSVIFIYSFSFMSCTLPAIGLIPILACIGITRLVKLWDKSRKPAENARTLLMDCFTFQNVCTGLFVTLTSYLFLKANTTGNSGFRKADMPNLLMNYLLFVLLEFLIYYLVIYSQRHREPLYWVTLGTLLVVPLICFGPHVDFVMRASIPSLVVLFVMMMQTIGEHREAGRKQMTALLIGLLMVGSITAYHEIARCVCITVEHSTNAEIHLTADEIDLYEDGNRGNFFGEYQDSAFFKYLAKS